jgi:hypothetical protein
MELTVKLRGPIFDPKNIKNTVRIYTTVKNSLFWMSERLTIVYPLVSILVTANIIRYSNATVLRKLHETLKQA